MNNFTQINLKYDPIEILECIPDYNKRGARLCDNLVVNKINSLLNLVYTSTTMLYFAVSANKQAEIHIDENIELSNVPGNFALNLPLLNSQDTDMQWFRKKDINIPDSYNVGHFTGKFRVLRYDDAECVDVVTYTQPTIVNICDYHAVRNRSNDPSYFISLRFGSSVTKEMLIKSLQD